LIQAVRNPADAACLYNAAMLSVDKAVVGETEAKRALLVAIAGRFALAITGPTGAGKTFLVHQALPLISDLDDGEAAWIPTFGMFPGWLLDGRERVIPGKGNTITQREFSMLEQRPNAKVLVFDMLDVIDDPGNGKELWRFAKRLQEPWSQNIVPVEPHLTQARLLISTWIPPNPHHNSEAPANMRRLHHIAVSMGSMGRRKSKAESRELIRHFGDASSAPATPVACWGAFDDVGVVARNDVHLDERTWERAGLASERRSLGAMRATVAEDAARILAAYSGRQEVSDHDLTDAMRWARMASEC
jgi:hypothetical protein